jgi:hypothetical protein
MLTTRATVKVLGENNPRKGKSAPVLSSLSNTGNYEIVTSTSDLPKTLAIGTKRGRTVPEKGQKSMALQYP